MGLSMYWLLMFCLCLMAMDLGLVAAFFVRQELELRAKRRRARLYGFDKPGSYPKWEKGELKGVQLPGSLFFPNGSSIKFKEPKTKSKYRPNQADADWFKSVVGKSLVKPKKRSRRGK